MQLAKAKALDHCQTHCICMCPTEPEGWALSVELTRGPLSQLPKWAAADACWTCNCLLRAYAHVSGACGVKLLIACLADLCLHAYGCVQAQHSLILNLESPVMVVWSLAADIIESDSIHPGAGSATPLSPSCSR